MKVTTSLSSVFLAISVGCGAFGAHALQGSLSPADMVIWDKAVLYHMVHALGALILSLHPAQVNQSDSLVGPPKELANPSHSPFRFIIVLLLASTVIFSGSLYLLVLSQLRWLGAITPIGGSGFIAAWLLLAWLTLRQRGESR